MIFIQSESRALFLTRDAEEIMYNVVQPARGHDEGMKNANILSALVLFAIELEKEVQ